SATSLPNDNDLSSPQDTAAEEESDLHPSRSKWSLPISVFFRDARHVFRMDALGREILRIAFPAALALAANRATSFVDTAFIHHLGPVESTAAKYSTFLFNQVVNIFTFPLTIVAASRVAKDKALTATTSIVAAILGILLPLALTYGAKTIFAFLGVRSAPIQTSAESYLRLRCIGAPAILISHAMQGVFLGFKDARTHFYATVAGSLANIALDPILIFFCKLGVRGVTVAHVSSRYLIFLILLWRLTKKIYLLPPSVKDIDFRQFLKTGFLVLVRVIVLTTYLSFATFLVTRLGSTFTAVNEACLLVWTIASFTANGLAVAGQVIITSGFAKKDYDKATVAVSRLLQMGVVLGLGLAVIVSVFLRFGTRLLSKDVNVQHHIFVGIPFVAATQAISSLAFVSEGVTFGSLDFAYSAYSMVLVSIVTGGSLFLLYRSDGFVGIWGAFIIHMSLRTLAEWEVGLDLGAFLGSDFLHDVPQNFGVSCLIYTS
ncbi:hypothetical protein ACJRO7_029407, partial [Eucalyptus globulus]